MDKSESLYKKLYKVDPHSVLSGNGNEAMEDHMSLTTGHTLLYILGISFILMLAILQEVFGLLSFFGNIIGFIFSDSKGDEEMRQFMLRRADAQFERLQQLNMTGKGDKEGQEVVAGAAETAVEVGGAANKVVPMEMEQ